MENASVSTAVQSLSLPGQKSGEKRFRTLAEDVLQYGAGLSPFDDYDAWAKVFADAAAIFALPDTVWFIPCLQATALRLVDLAIATDKQRGSRQYTKTIDAAGRLSKCAGLAANDRTPLPGRETKRFAVLGLANLSFRAYFKLNNTRLCETVLGSVQNSLLINQRHATPPIETGDEVYTLAERVTYRYYLGQIRLIQHQIQVAAKHLNWAFSHCTHAQAHNRRKILASLVPVELVLGRYASRRLLLVYQLEDEYAQLLAYHRIGYGYGVLQEIERHCDWLRTRGLYMILREKVMLGVWRNLFRRCLFLTHAGDVEKPPILRMASLLGAVRMAWGNPTLTLEDIECMAANLIDQGLIKAYIWHSKGLLVLQKGPQRGFPLLASVYA